MLQSIQKYQSLTTINFHFSPNICGSGLIAPFLTPSQVQVCSISVFLQRNRQRISFYLGLMLKTCWSPGRRQKHKRDLYPELVLSLTLTFYQPKQVTWPSRKKIKIECRSASCKAW